VPGGFRRRRRAGADEGEEREGELGAAAAELSSALGAVPIDEARMAAIERLTELRTAGAISAEAFERERKRLQEYG